MFSIIEAKEKNGSNIRVTINSEALNQIRNINAKRLALVIIDSLNLNNDDSWDEIEDFFQTKLNELGKSIFISKIVREESAELYYYIDDNVKSEDCIILKSNWNHKTQIINDPKQMIYQEMKNSNFLESQEIKTISELPELFKMWKENNIDVQNEFTIMFSFYSAFKNETENFVQNLKELKYNVESKTKRTLIIFKGYVSNAEKKQKWNIDNLKEEFTSVLFLAKKNENVYEGIFARE